MMSEIVWSGSRAASWTIASPWATFTMSLSSNRSVQYSTEPEMPPLFSMRFKVNHTLRCPVQYGFVKSLLQCGGKIQSQS